MATATPEEAPALGAPGGAQSAEALLLRLEWTAIRRLDGLLHGDYSTLMRGPGMDLADLRVYQHHDDVRHIDWNVTARMQEPHVRVFTEDRDMAVWFLLDTSPSLDAGSGRLRKRDLAESLVGVLARIFSRSGCRVGAVVYDGQSSETTALGSGDLKPGGINVVPARTGRGHLLRLLHTLRQSRRPPKKTTTTELDELLRAALPLLRRRSTVFLVSDFVSEPGWDARLSALAQRHDVVAVRLLDPLDQTLPDLGLVPMHDPETGATLLVDTHDAGFRRRFARLAAEHETQLRDALQRAGVDTLALSTEDDLVDALMRFSDARRGRVRSALHAAPPTAAEVSA